MFSFFKNICVERTRKCCSSKFEFGPECEPCLVGENNRVCSGRGECNGAGDRAGVGNCVCQPGATGQSCDLCQEDHFMHADENCQVCSPHCKVKYKRYTKYLFEATREIWKKNFKHF